jgi:putative two-component system response regulator
MVKISRSRILVVDDTKTNVDILVEALSDEYDVSVAMDGATALALAEEIRPDLILLDIMMPDMDGYEVCTTIKSNHEIRQTPIIFLSGIEDIKAKVRGLSLGAVDYITKPFDVEEVMARVGRQLELLEDRRQLIAANQRLMLQTSHEGKSATEQSRWIGQVIERGEGESTEFKSTLRWNLRKGDKDIAVEGAWLKTIVAFLNSNGGTLLVGVADDGSAVGLELDCFENEDKCSLYVNSRIQRNIGLEFASCIRYSLQTVDEQRILVVECSPSTEPAFLLSGGDEAFYVRIGPGSRKLSARQILTYLAQRKSPSD